MSPGPSCALCAGGTSGDPSPHPGTRRALSSPGASASTQSLPPQHPCSCCGCHSNRASLSLSLSLQAPLRKNVPVLQPPLHGTQLPLDFPLSVSASMLPKAVGLKSWFPRTKQAGQGWLASFCCFFLLPPKCSSAEKNK